MHTYYGMALDLTRQIAVLVQVVELNCEQKYPRSGGARKSNAQDLLGRGLTSVSVCDTESASYRETIALQTDVRVLW
jgi:hypothetical protein